jgi:CRP-like cAMP-binding protein
LFPRGIVLSAMADDVAFARALNTICAQRTRRLAERYTDRHARTALARVAAAILPYAAPDVGLAPSLEPLRRMTQAQLALSAGTAKEVAARAIAELEAAGAIERARGRIARIDRRKLGAIVDGR